MGKDPRLEEDGAMVPVKVETAVLTQITKGEVDMQVATAKQYPRSIKRFMNDARSLALLDEETAESCFYMIPRGGKQIQGPSVRLAEIVANSWGNLRAETRVIDEAHGHVTSQASVWDLEKNVAIRTEVRRRITDKYGKRYSEDMIAVTANAASSIALRNAVFKVVPLAHVKPIYEDCLEMAKGSVATLSERRGKAVTHFAKFGVVLEQVLTALGKPSLDDVDLEDVVKLKGWAQAVKEDGASIDDIFAPLETKAAKGKGMAGAKAALKAKQEKPAPEEKPTANEAPAGMGRDRLDEEKSPSEMFGELYELASDKGLAPGDLKKLAAGEVGCEPGECGPDQLAKLIERLEKML